MVAKERLVHLRGDAVGTISPAAGQASGRDVVPITVTTARTGHLEETAGGGERRAAGGGPERGGGGGGGWETRGGRRTDPGPSPLLPLLPFLTMTSGPISRHYGNGRSIAPEARRAPPSVATNNSKRCHGDRPLARVVENTAAVNHQTPPPPPSVAIPRLVSDTAPCWRNAGTDTGSRSGQRG